MTTVRPLESTDVKDCLALVKGNWGAVSTDRALEQMYDFFKGGKYAPKFFVAERAGGNWAEKIVGFAAYQRSMRMHGAFDLIWLAVDELCHSSGVGKKLTEHRIAEVKKLDASVVTLVTQKPSYFKQFGFIIGAHFGSGWVEMVLVLKPADMS